MKPFPILVIAGLCCSATALAQQPTEAGQEGPWSGKATLGYLATTGNAENSSLNAGFEVAYTSGNWMHSLTGVAINAAQQDVTTAEAYGLGWKTDYTLSEFSYIYGRVDWRKDQFSGYNQQLSETLGYGRRLIDTEAHTLNAEIGVGARQLEAQDGTEEDDVVLRGGFDYAWRLSETAEFTQLLAVESGDTNTFIESITALSATLINDLALVASYTIRNNSDVPVGLEKTDTFTALSLEYTF